MAARSVRSWGGAGRGGGPPPRPRAGPPAPPPRPPPAGAAPPPEGGGAGAVLLDPFAPTPEEQPLVEPDPQVEELPDEPVDEPIALAQECADPDGDYTVSYPDDWHANEPCRAFAEEPVEGWDDAIGGPEGLGEIDIAVEDVAFEDLVAPALDEVELEAESATVDGRDAHRAHLEHTGEGVLPEGLESYVYYVDLGDRTLIARTVDPGDGTFEERREVLDRMMATIEVHTDG
jgi:hypothetical protein